MIDINFGDTSERSNFIPDLFPNIEKEIYAGAEGSSSEPFQVKWESYEEVKAKEKKEQ